jgi:hypothetical protein
MDSEFSSVAVEECVEAIEVTESRRSVCPKLLAIILGICTYITLAAVYFFGPGNPVVSIGSARFTPDCLLELLFTLIILPSFAFAYLHGLRNYDLNPDFPVSDTLIDVMVIVALAWVAIGNGIHLTAKLDEQMVAQLTDQQVVGLRANFHWIRQVAGHVFPHIGWQLLFCALMLGQLRRPYRGREHNTAVLYIGCLFGLLFAHGAIAGTCTHLGFVLTAASLLGFSYLLRRTGLPSGEVPVLKFFFASQVTFLFVVATYWVVFHSPKI